MTYSRQQRDRAVDLYIRYECCAADAIHELGYPSKEALRMWYRERLEEERTGVPSRRGKRQRRYSEEQKRTAVDHYLECGRRLSRTMRMLGYPMFLVKSVFRVSSLIFFGFRHEECRPVVCFTGCPSCRT